MQTINLPTPIPAPAYDRVAVDRVEVYPLDRRWGFLVYGIPQGSDQPAPLVVQTLHRGVQRIERMYVPFESIPEGTPSESLQSAITADALAQLQDLMTSEPPVEPTPEAEA